MLISSSRNSSKFAVEALELKDEVIPTTATARNLGVTIDSTLQLDSHIANVTRVCFYYLRWIWQIRKYISAPIAKTLVHSFILSRLDYCNSILVGLPKTKIHKFQRIMNSSARLITRKSKRDHIIESLKELHWLPVKERTEYKMLTLTFKALNGLAPRYLTELLTPYVPERSLRSSDKLLLKVPKYKNNYGYRSFRHMAPCLWNELPFFS